MMKARSILFTGLLNWKNESTGLEGAMVQSEAKQYMALSMWEEEEEKRKGRRLVIG